MALAGDSYDFRGDYDIDETGFVLAQWMHIYVACSEEAPEGEVSMMSYPRIRESSRM